MWSSNFVGSESGQKQSVKLLQNLVFNTTQHHTTTLHTLSIYSGLWLCEGERGGVSDFRQIIFVTSTSGNQIGNIILYLEIKDDCRVWFTIATSREHDVVGPEVSVTFTGSPHQLYFTKETFIPLPAHPSLLPTPYTSQNSSHFICHLVRISRWPSTLACLL